MSGPDLVAHGSPMVSEEMLKVLTRGATLLVGLSFEDLIPSVSGWGAGGAAWPWISPHTPSPVSWTMATASSNLFFLSQPLPWAWGWERLVGLTPQPPLPPQSTPAPAPAAPGTGLSEGQGSKGLRHRDRIVGETLSWVSESLVWMGDTWFNQSGPHGVLLVYGSKVVWCALWLVTGLRGDTA